MMPAQYYLGWRRKKKAIYVRSEMAWSLRDLTYMKESMQWKMEIGRGRNRPGGGYYFL